MSQSVGFGLFSTSEIQKGMFIVEYVGELVSTEAEFEKTSF